MKNRSLAVTAFVGTLLLLASVFAPVVSAADQSNNGLTSISNTPSELDPSQMDTWTPEQIAQFFNSSKPAIYFSNQQIFDSLRTQGIEAKNILSKEDYQQALFQDDLRQGGTYIKILGPYEYRIYLNSAIVKLLIIGGGFLIGAKLVPLLKPLLSVAGISATTAQLNGITNAVSTAWGMLQHNRGIWIDIRTLTVIKAGPIRLPSANPLVTVGLQ
ncbi:MAG: hypothetical protein LKI92_08765 [Schleiferilactobacillus harbinensis]|jgi:hypothetical protein|nr:hypothetical protein [Schleiferilactobacillus harbinensis]MCI1913965.1 hypothetical protein [Schleiferilactobacillus harbinensis]